MRRPVLLVVVALLLGLVVAPSSAAPRPKPKPIKKAWTAEAFPPDPSHVGVTEGICNTTLEQSRFDMPFTVPYAGTLKLDMKGFTGDWDLAVYQGTRLLAQSAQDVDQPIDRPESITMKFRRGGAKLLLRSCNFAGGPTADVSMVFTAA